MKKLLLLIASGSIAFTGTAQYRSMIMDRQDQIGESLKFVNHLKSEKQTNTANKTTAAPKRWYYYPDYLNAMLTATVSQEVSGRVYPMWNDTTSARINYTSGTSFINRPSIGSIFDPSSPSFNHSDYYEGEMKITTEAYVVDSVSIAGRYFFNPSVTGIKDTIRLAFVTGSGGTAATDNIFGGELGAGGHYPSATFMTMRHDSIKNIVGTGGPAIYIQDIILDNSSPSDTGFWGRNIALTTPLSVPANAMVGMSITFKSGDPSITGGTIVFDATTQTANKNIWMPSIQYASDASGVAQWAPYDAADNNVGLFKTYPGILGWANQYICTWAWSAGGGSAASELQFPNVAFHVNCATCTTNVPPPSPPPPPGSVNGVASINTINAVPNPADNTLNIPFTLSASANVTVTLSNMIGQVVATQHMGNVSTGKAVFNTTSLPAGLYTYNVNANGLRNTGNVVIAH